MYCEVEIKPVNQKHVAFNIFVKLTIECCLQKMSCLGKDVYIIEYQYHFYICFSFSSCQNFMNSLFTSVWLSILTKEGQDTPMKASQL